jgi:hypothetical protein
MNRQPINRTGKTAGAGLMLAAVVVLALMVGGASASGGERAGAAVTPTSVSVSVMRTSQHAILSTGKLRARVRTGVPGSVKVTPKRVAARGHSRRIGRSRRVRFDAPGSKVVAIRLSKSGRRLLSNCGAQTLVFVARLTPAPGSVAAARRGAGQAPLTIDLSRCGPGGGGGGGGNGGGGGGNGNVVPPAQPYTGPAIDTANSARCDFLDPAVCLQPFPNDYFTVIDEGTDTDRRLNLNLQSMPANKAGKPIDPTDHNRNDGFSPGSMLITRVPGLQSQQAFDNTGAVPITNISAYDDPNQPIVVINADTGERQPIWSEIDSNPIDPARCDATPPLDEPGKTRLCEPDDVNLIIRPAVNFDEGARYVVALRNMKDASNQTIQPSNAFKVYRDNLTTTQPAVESRRPHMEDLFATLGAAGIQRSSLYLAWDFTVASERNLTERALTIRDDAFSKLGDTNLGDLTVQGTSPTFSVDSTTNFTPAQNSQIAREVTGSVTVPCYLNAPGCTPASRFTYLPGSDVPVTAGAAINTMSAPFTCEIPRSAIDPGAPNPGKPSLYGHGLLGQGTEVSGGNVEAMAGEHNFVFCATDWAGFSFTDVPTVLASLQDLSNFGALVDRMQQGFVNQMYLGRAMIHANGFSSNAAFRDDGASVINTQRLFYDGNSQGGIMSGALTALEPDYQRAVFGVPGMNYSTLLTRSVDFEPYAEGQFGDTIEEAICSQAGSLPDQFGDFRQQLEDLCAMGVPDDTDLGLYDNYPNQLERPLIFALMQILWDRGEANGYAHHITTDPLEDTPSHTVLLDAAFGDHQVSNVTAEVEARTIGASVYQPALDPGRHWAQDPFFGIPSISSFPYSGSALVYWDGGPVSFTGTRGQGSGTPPNGNIPPRPTTGFGGDPHSYPRNDVKARAQKAAFLALNGSLQNPCTTVNSPDPAPGMIVFNTGTFIPCHSNGWTGPGG